MKRLPDWDIRLAKFLESRKDTPFAWGTNDCTTFCCDAVLAMTGVDYAPAELRVLRTAKEAYRAIKKFSNGSDIVGVVNNTLGAAKHKNYATVGDVVSFVYNTEETLGICNGDNILTVTKNGIISVSMNCATNTWKI